MRFILATTGLIAGVVALSAPLQAQIAVQDPGYTLTEILTGLRNPQGIATDAQDNVYIADSGNGRVLRGPAGGPFSPIVTSIPTINFGGQTISALSLLVTSDEELLIGRAGLVTAQPPILHVELDGTPIQTISGVTNGGNWKGLAQRDDGAIYATSSNGDRLFRAPVNGASFGPLTQLSVTAPLIAPTGIVIVDDTMYVSFFGSFVSSGFIVTADPDTGAVVNSAFSINIVGGATSLGLLPDGDLVVSEQGDTPNSGTIQRVDPETGVRLPIASGINLCPEMHVAADGSIYFAETGTPNLLEGRVLRLTPVTPGCAGDLDGDGDTDLGDLGVVLADFGCTSAPCSGDLDGDGDTDLGDLGVVLADFGCTP